MNLFTDWRESENIYPVTIPEKDRYFNDLMNIENSLSGRMDIGNIGNTFIMEAAQQLINAIVLFEKGYFDCAFYSLRSAIEVSTIMVYLADMPDEKRKIQLDAWKDTKDYFPMYGKMTRQLSTGGNIYIDMKEKMSDFFRHEEELNAKLNKYVHKQGLQFFYISRNHPLNQHKSRESFIQEFEYYLTQCIGIVAVMRLAIDPFPILLMDEEILYRCFDSMTDPYSEEFIDKYIGLDTIEAYKQTELYLNTYDSFIRDEKKTEAVFEVVKYQCIDSTKMDEICKQLHLMTKEDVISVLLVKACSKAVKVYCMNGFLMYFTDKKTNRKKTEYSGRDFMRFANADDKINQPYDEAYISVFFFDGEPYYIEHNELLDKNESESIPAFVSGELSKIQRQ